MKRVKLEAIVSEGNYTNTVFEVEDIESSEEVSQLMLAMLQRVAYEWIKGGMEKQHCYNLFIHAVRNADTFIDEEIEDDN